MERTRAWGRGGAPGFLPSSGHGENILRSRWYLCPSYVHPRNTLSTLLFFIPYLSLPPGPLLPSLAAPVPPASPRSLLPSLVAPAPPLHPPVPLPPFSRCACSSRFPLGLFSLLSLGPPLHFILPCHFLPSLAAPPPLSHPHPAPPSPPGPAHPSSLIPHPHCSTPLSPFIKCPFSLHGREKYNKEEQMNPAYRYFIYYR